ncbi:ATP-binding protein [Kitasatospora sp. NPDC085879]|uniref:ATP-binding protein n=1 Tax=Kitasatospora sp. NPDC085879 TaxID=3154769 RepID=UPI003423439F
MRTSDGWTPAEGDRWGVPEQGGGVLMDGQARFQRRRPAVAGPGGSRAAAGGRTAPDGTPPGGRGAPGGRPAPGGEPRTGGAEGSARAGGPPSPRAAPDDAPVRGAGRALHRRLHAVLEPADLAAVGAVRRRLRAVLDRWGLPPELADTAELLASELVTNALVHTPHGAVFDVELSADRRLRIEVRDGAPGLPGRRAPGDYATSGRGLLLVEAMADDWGVQLRGDGKTTWFELGPS